MKTIADTNINLAQAIINYAANIIYQSDFEKRMLMKGDLIQMIYSMDTRRQRLRELAVSYAIRIVASKTVAFRLDAYLRFSGVISLIAASK